MTAGLLNRRQVLVAGAAMLASTALARAHNGTVHVTIEKLAFQPADIEAKVGETIEWTNTPDGAAKQFRREWFQGDGMVRRKNLPIEYNP